METNQYPSRLIEFRAWHKPNQRMYAVSSFDDDFVYLSWTENKTDKENYKLLARPDCVLLQFTGVYDAKGVKIFEGDILYWRYYDESESKLFESWHLVVFRNGAFGTLDGDEDLNTFNDLTIGDVVVGNAYEHLDLLALCQPKNKRNVMEVSTTIQSEFDMLWLKYGRYLFEKREDYDLFLQLESPTLNGEKPIDHASKQGSAGDVVDLLGRWVSGVW